MMASIILRPSRGTVSRLARLSSRTKSTSSSFLPSSRSPFPASHVLIPTTISVNQHHEITRFYSTSSPSRSTSSATSTSSPPPGSSSSSSSSSYLPLPSQIHVVPFLIPPEVAAKQLATASMFADNGIPRSVLVWLLHRLWPSYFPNKIRLVKSQMIYLPAWSVRAKIKIKVTATKGLRPLAEDRGPNEDFNGELPETREVGLESATSFFPGTTSSPLGQLSLRQTLPNLPEHLPIYDTSRHLEQYGETITALPFDLSPLVLPDLVRKSKSYKRLLFPDEKKAGYFVVENLEKDVRWEQFDVTPLYLPLYLAKYEYEGREATFLLEATNKDIGRCEAHAPNSDRDDLIYPESPYRRVSFDASNTGRSYPNTYPVTRRQARFIQPSLFDLRSVAKSQVTKDMWEDPTKELEEYLTEEWEETNRIESLLSWIVMREGDEWLLGSDGVSKREMIRRLSLRSEQPLFGRVGRIVRWVGAEEREGEEED